MRLGSNNVWNPTKDDAKFWLGHNSGYTLDGATIEHWANLASYGGRFSQVTESLRPVRQVSEGITGGALFDGTDDYLAGTQFTLTGEFTIGVKLKILDEVANNDVCIGDLTTANNFIRLNSVTQIGIKTTGSQKTIDSNEAGELFNENDTRVLVIGRDGADLVSAWVDGNKQDDTETSAGNFLIDGLGARSGPANLFSGIIYEFIVFNQSSDELSKNLSEHLMALKID